MTNQDSPVKRSSTLAQLIRMYAECKGITSTKQLAELIGVTERAIRKAKAEQEFPGTIVPRNVCSAGTGTYVPPPGTIVPPEPEQEFRPEPRVHARNEYPSGITISKGISPPTPSPAFESKPDEVCVGHGVWVNCQTIRHKDFVISLPAIELGTVASGKSRDEIKAECQAHALQWAAEIEAGKWPSQVVPAKIANFLSASIMGSRNRALSAQAKSRVVPQDEFAAVMAKRRAKAREAAAHG